MSRGIRTCHDPKLRESDCDNLQLNDAEWLTSCFGQREGVKFCLFMQFWPRYTFKFLPKKVQTSAMVGRGRRAGRWTSTVFRAAGALRRRRQRLPLMRPSLSPLVQVPEPHVWHAPQRDDPTAKSSREGRAGGGDADCRLQGLQSRNWTGGILAAWGRDGASHTHTHTSIHFSSLCDVTEGWFMKLSNAGYCKKVCQNVVT